MASSLSSWTEQLRITAWKISNHHWALFMLIKYSVSTDGNLVEPCLSWQILVQIWGTKTTRPEQNLRRMGWASLRDKQKAREPHVEAWVESIHMCSLFDDTYNVQTKVFGPLVKRIRPSSLPHTASAALMMLRRLSYRKLLQNTLVYTSNVMKTLLQHSPTENRASGRSGCRMIRTNPFRKMTLCASH